MVKLQDDTGFSVKTGGWPWKNCHVAAHNPEAVQWQHLLRKYLLVALTPIMVELTRRILFSSPRIAVLHGSW
jgi:hypothetical protein